MASDNFAIATGDVIGWTINRDEGVISISYVEQAQTLFRNLDPGYPSIGEVYTFDQIPLPAKFSMAVKVIPGKSYI